MLDALLSEASDDPELWYLYGVLYLRRPAPDASPAKAKAFLVEMLAADDRLGKEAEAAGREYEPLEDLLQHAKVRLDGLGGIWLWRVGARVC